MSKKKTNVDYLREIIEKNMPELHKDEAIEFLDGIQKEYDDFNDEVKEAEDEAKEWEQKYDNLDEEVGRLEAELEEKSGYLPEESLQHKLLNESFFRFVNDRGPLQAERILDELNQAPYLKKANG
jgi:uncharacterized coiled-coil DUF342 family protein